MAHVQNGDHHAFSMLYDRYATRLKAFFYRMLWSQDEAADDHVQELFTKIIERPEKFNTNLSFKSWIFMVAANMCKNTYRKRRFEEDYLNKLNENGLLQPGIERYIDEKIIANSVHSILNQLEEDKRDLFLMRYQQEFSIRELSEVFEISEGTVKSRLYYIKKHLTNVLEKQDLIG